MRLVVLLLGQEEGLHESTRRLATTTGHNALDEDEDTAVFRGLHVHTRNVYDGPAQIQSIDAGPDLVEAVGGFVVLALGDLRVEVLMGVEEKGKGTGENFTSCRENGVKSTKGGKYQ